MLNFRSGYVVCFCLLLILMDFMGLTICIVTFPHILLSEHGFLPAGLTHNYKFAFFGVLLALYPLGQFFGASIFGRLSDTLGRRKTLLITLFGTLFGFLMTAVSVTISAPFLLFFGRLITGLFAGNVAIAQAILSDVSSEQTKAKNISLSQAAMGLAFVFGPILGAYLSSSDVVPWFGLATPFWFFSIIFMLLILFVMLFLFDGNCLQENKGIDTWGGLQHIYQGFSSPYLRLVIFTWFMFCLGWWLYEAFMPAFLYTHFHFDTLQVGHVLAFNGSLFVLSQMFVVSQVAKKIRPERLVKFSAGFAGISMLSLAYVSVDFVYVSMAAFVVSMSFSLPSLITSISGIKGKESQGQIMGIINSTQAFATVLVMMGGGLINLLHTSGTIVGGGIVTIVAWGIYTFSFRRATNSTK